MTDTTIATIPTLTSFTCPGCGFEGSKFDHHDGTFTELCGDCRDEADRAINGWTPENSLD